jgi:hypothetical protein
MRPFPPCRPSSAIPQEGDGSSLCGAFVAKLAERGLPIDTCRQLRKRLRYLLDAREVADHREDTVDAGMAIDALEIAREALRFAEEFAA